MSGCLSILFFGNTCTLVIIKTVANAPVQVMANTNVKSTSRFKTATRGIPVL